MTARTLSRPLPLRAGWNTFYDLDRVHVVDPFVTLPEPGATVYWRLHGIGGARHSYTDGELQRLWQLLRGIGSEQPAYVLFNNLPRVADAKRFARLAAASARRCAEVASLP